MRLPRRRPQLAAWLIAAAAIAVIAAHGTATVHAASYDYVRNGGFENGTAEWSAHGADLETDGSVRIEGSSSAKLTAFDIGTVTLRQSSFADVAPGSYELSLAVMRSSASADVRVRISPGSACSGSGCDVVVAGIAGEWIRIDTTFRLEVAGALGVAIIEFGATSGDVLHVDDVRLVGPPPVTPTPTATPTPPATATEAPTGTPTKTPRSTSTPNTSDTPNVPASPSPAAAAPTGELRNPGFESQAVDGTPSDWYRYGGILSTDSAHTRTGRGAARLESSTSATKWLYQTVTVNPGAGYAFDAWLFADDESVSAAFLRVSWYASDDGSGTAIATRDSTERLSGGSGGYSLLTTGGIAAPGSAHSARLRLVLAPSSSATAVIYADDASWAPADVAESAPSAGAVPVDTPSDEGTAPEQPTQHVLAESRKPAARTAAKVSATRPGPAVSGPRGVVINEVYYDPDGAGANIDGEWVELYNSSESTVSLDGWSLRDKISTTSLPPADLGAHEFLVFTASDSFAARYPEVTGRAFTVGHIGNGLGNDGDRLTLEDDAGGAVDAISWGTDASILSPSITDAPTGHSIERRVAGADTDNAADFVDNDSPSPGRAIPAAGNPKRRQSPSSTASLVAADHPFAWLPWVLAAASVVALIAALAWRAAPVVAQQIRRRL